MKKIFLFIFLAVAFFAKAQLADDFADGNFTADPSWSGDSERFRINADHQLQLFDSGSGTAMLATASYLFDSTEWQFHIRLGFSPSSNNFARIYLASDQADLTGMLNGFFLQFGEQGTSDAPELFRQEGLTTYPICRGTDGSIAQAFALNIRVTHLSDGSWNIFSAPGDSHAFQFLASGSDATLISPAHAGVLCTYTSSNSQKFYFDDFLIQPVLKDTVPPAIEQLYPVSSTRLHLRFTETVNGQDATHTGHYSLASSGQIPDSATLDPNDPNRVVLGFTTPFIIGSFEDLLISGIHDMAGNLLRDTVVPFVWYIPQVFDILISEIMADPDPSSGLPPVEYIELFNACDFPVRLKDWRLTISGSPRIFPETGIAAKSYLLVTKEAGLSEFGACALLLTSSYSLSNEGTAIALFNAAGQLIHSVTYAADWYDEEWKKDGGWSLELVDPMNPCTEEGNWEASTDPSGGTPGRVNSCLMENRDTIPPRLAGIGIEAKDWIRIWFSEKMDSTTLLDPGLYNLEPHEGHATIVLPAGDFYHSVLVRLPFPLEEAASYQLSLTGGVTDCAGNEMDAGARLPAGLPAIADNMDIVINEILLDPSDPGAAFIELYNRTDRFFDIKDLVLARMDTVRLVLTSVQAISDESYLLAPGRYMVLSPDPFAVIRHYHCPDPDAFVKMSGWPVFSREASVIVLACRHDEKVIDQVYYRESLHFDLVSNPEGVSLERIHFSRPSGDDTNWHSASQSSGYATPGYQNSQFTGDIVQPDDWLTVEPELFTPDNDGMDDLLAVCCSEHEPGWVASIQVFDAAGRLVNYLVDNALMGMNNIFTWDGKDQDGNFLPTGIYIIFAQIFDLYGNAKTGKRACVLVRQDLR
ncbi:MAG TPA: lamin tail domain-containing protein [Bacteroidales bacterium]|nr:lamin tail domain-containing protein [Bacteroidales bacterium]HRZ20883.1 lamin tail domain-containing protein [Bacteroidales bacterium]